MDIADDYISGFQAPFEIVLGEKLSLTTDAYTVMQMSSEPHPH